MKYFLFLVVAFSCCSALAFQNIICSTKVNPQFKNFSKLQLIIENNGMLKNARMHLVGTNGNLQGIQLRGLKYPVRPKISSVSAQEVVYNFQGYSLFLPLTRTEQFSAVMTSYGEDGGSARWAF